MAPHFVSGFCLEQRPSCSPLSAGSRLEQFHTFGAGVPDAPQDPDSLLKFLLVLATSSKTNLGFDESVVRLVGRFDFDLQLTVQDTVYHASRLLYDLEL